jgi:hypothetical protein
MLPRSCLREGRGGAEDGGLLTAASDNLEADGQPAPCEAAGHRDRR